MKNHRLVEASYLSGIPNPYYTQDHISFQAALREYLDKEVVGHLDDWIERKQYPHHIHVAFHALGVQQAVFRVTPDLGGPSTGRYDSIHEMIVWTELARISLNSVTFMLGIDAMALPPIIHHGPSHLRSVIVPGVVSGKMHVALAISEPTAGSDVANIKTTAVRRGDMYVINGEKKWITGAAICDYFTCVVRTGGPGASGISIVVIPRNTEGVTVRAMKMQFDSVMYTGFVTFDNVSIPIANLVGFENQGFKIIMENFNHERFIIGASALGCARRSFELALVHATKRKTFGQFLIDHQLIRFKLAEMSRTVEAMQAQTEHVAYVLDHCSGSSLVLPKAVGEICALMKVNCTKGFEYCAREAAQIFGGSSLVKEGIGKEVEAFYRNVRAHAIPGGSEEVLLDLAIRSVASLKQAKV